MRNMDYERIAQAILHIYFPASGMLMVWLSDADFRTGPSDDVELAHGRLLSPAALIEPLPVGRGGEDGAVLAAASVWLQGDFRLPVLEAYVGAWVVQPLTVSHHIIDAQPDVLLWADALAHVVVELVILVSWGRRAEDPSFGDAVFTSGMKGPLHRISQETFADYLGASQTHWGREMDGVSNGKCKINVQNTYIPVCKACCSFSTFSSWARSLTCFLSSSIAELLAESVEKVPKILESKF